MHPPNASLRGAPEGNLGVGKRQLGPARPSHGPLAPARLQPKGVRYGSEPPPEGA
jgi:hypothetical protein